MRRVLFLAYYFPPLGGAGVQRTVKFARYLPEFGYEPVVVTGPASTSLAWSPADGTFQREIPAEIEVHRINTPEPPRSSGWRRRSERWLRRPSSFTRWWVEGAIALGRDVAKNTDMVYASMSPFESAEAAAAIARDLGRPWIADLRDPWALDEWLIYPTGLHRRLELRRMRAALRSASAIVMNTSEAERELRRRFPELGTKVFVIPNGYDSADFEGISAPREDRSFRIVYTGYVHTQAGRRHQRMRLARRLVGGSVRGLTVLSRSAVYLLEAVDELLESRPELRSRLEVHLGGVGSDEDHETVASEVVRVHGYLPHEEAVELIRSADLLFLPMHDLPAGVRSLGVPGKTYEYLASGRPILAAVPDGDARELLARAGTAMICRPTDIRCMRSVIEAGIERVLAGRRGPVIRPDVLRGFERRELAGRLADLFENVSAATAATADRPGESQKSALSR